MRTRLICLLSLAFLAAPAPARHRHARSLGRGGQPGDFDYYILSLSWAPAFCATHSGQGTARECDPSRHAGFVVHGLWPQKENARVENCGSVPPVSSSIVNLMIAIMPSAGLIQHEWQTHGSCSGLSAQDFFAAVRQDYASVHVPAEFQNPHQNTTQQTATIEQDFATASALAGPNSVHVECSGSELTEVRLCFTKDGHSRACSASVGECQSASVDVRPVP